MSILNTLACGMVDYDHPDLGKDAKKQIRRAVRDELRERGFTITHRLKKTKSGPRHTRPTVRWDVVAWEIDGTLPNGQRYYNVAKSLNSLCADALLTLKPFNPER